MKEKITTKVTTINDRYHCRLLWNGDEVLNEMACKRKDDISYCIRYMMRMYDKMGGMSLMADASRHRLDAEGHGKNQVPNGKVWYPSQIPVKE